MVEQGEDVVDHPRRHHPPAGAYNLAAPASGRIMSGGIDAGALYPPKKFFGAARNVEEGGSLTILATALVDTNSRMDDAIFEEFKGTGNMELRLDRQLAERRIYPAIDVDASSTRHEELLFDRKQLQMVWKLRRVLSGLAADGNAAPGLELLMDRLKTFRTNDEFLNEIAKQPSMWCPLLAGHLAVSHLGGRRTDPLAVTGAAVLAHPPAARAASFHWSSTMKTDIHPTYTTRREVLVRQHVHHPLDQGRRAAHRAVQRVPPVLHRQAEAGRLRWPRRALQQALRPTQAPASSRPTRRPSVSDERRPAARRQAAGAGPRAPRSGDQPRAGRRSPRGGARSSPASRVLLEDDPERGLGAALAWAHRQRVDELNVLADRGTGLLARRAGGFTTPIAVWHVEERTLLPAVAEPLSCRRPLPRPRRTGRHDRGRWRRAGHRARGRHR